MGLGFIVRPSQSKQQSGVPCDNPSKSVRPRGYGEMVLTCGCPTLTERLLTCVSYLCSVYDCALERCVSHLKNEVWRQSVERCNSPGRREDMLKRHSHPSLELLYHWRNAHPRIGISQEARAQRWESLGLCCLLEGQHVSHKEISRRADNLSGHLTGETASPDNDAVQDHTLTGMLSHVYLLLFISAQVSY